jgi:hypothetical protein
MMKAILLFAAMVATVSAQSCKCGGTDVTKAVKVALKLSETFGMDTDFCTICTGMSTGSTSDETESMCVCNTGCFPATAEIELSSGVKQMGSIAVGDKAHVGSSQYSDIYYFSTAMEDTMSKFVSLATADTKKPLLLTHGTK